MHWQEPDLPSPLSPVIRQHVDAGPAAGRLGEQQQEGAAVPLARAAQHMVAAHHPVFGVETRAARLGIVEIHHSLRSEEHTSELQSLMRISYAVFCLKKK